MASSKPSLVVVLLPEAEDDLLTIWGDNAQRYGLEHAENYLGFLKRGINSLAEAYYAGRAVRALPEYRYITLKHSRKGDGHYVIYQIDEANGLVNVFRVLHTKMDVKRRLEVRRGST